MENQSYTREVKTASDLLKVFTVLSTSKSYKLDCMADGFNESCIAPWAAYQEYTHPNDQHLYDVSAYIENCPKGTITFVSVTSVTITYKFDL